MISKIILEIKNTHPSHPKHMDNFVKELVLFATSKGMEIKSYTVENYSNRNPRKTIKPCSRRKTEL